MCCCKAVWVWKRFPHSRQKMAMSDPAEQRTRRSAHPVPPAPPVPHLLGRRIYRFKPACIYCGYYGIKGARRAEVSAPSRKIKISNATLQSNLVSTEHFSPAEIKSARFRGALTHEITEGQQTRWRRTHSNTLPSHFFNYQAGGKLWGKE